MMIVDRLQEPAESTDQSATTMATQTSMHVLFGCLYPKLATNSPSTALAQILTWQIMTWLSVVTGVVSCGPLQDSMIEWFCNICS